MEKQKIDKALLNVKEVRAYLGLGDTKTRELLNSPKSTFTVRIGNRLYANKKMLDKWIDQQSKKQHNIKL
ncbi:MAG: excisionase [Anaerostipes sp.]|nr:excisionase [Anaerostipes sp.]